MRFSAKFFAVQPTMNRQEINTFPCEYLAKISKRPLIELVAQPDFRTQRQVCGPPQPGKQGSQSRQIPDQITTGPQPAQIRGRTTEIEINALSIELMQFPDS